MTTPKKLLQEYLKGIDDVLKSGVDAEDLIEVKRQRLLFSSAINLIDNLASVRASIRRQKVTMSNRIGEVRNKLY